MAFQPDGDSFNAKANLGSSRHLQDFRIESALILTPSERDVVLSAGGLPSRVDQSQFPESSLPGPTLIERASCVDQSEFERVRRVD